MIPIKNVFHKNKFLISFLTKNGKSGRQSKQPCLHEADECVDCVSAEWERNKQGRGAHQTRLAGSYTYKFQAAHFPVRPVILIRTPRRRWGGGGGPATQHFKAPRID